jgi:hypothetical protein
MKAGLFNRSPVIRRMIGGNKRCPVKLHDKAPWEEDGSGGNHHSWNSVAQCEVSGNEYDKSSKSSPPEATWQTA